MNLQLIASPGGGSASALAIASTEPGWAFAGSNAGVLRAQILDGSLQSWDFLPDSPLGVLCLAVSPHFAAGHRLLAGTPQGIFFSDDAGQTWKPAQMPIAGSTVMALAYSGVEQIFLAGTLEDGACISRDGGRTWESRNFGLLDQAVFSLAFSPGFAGDGSAFLGAEGALYQTYNHARAWKELPFPEEAVPVLSLAVPQAFSENPTLLAGTETQGLWGSPDRGSHWQRLPLPASTVNALAFWGETLLAATEAGLFQSNDLGQTWECALNQPNALCLAVSPQIALAGWAEIGITFSRGGPDWQPVRDFSTRVCGGPDWQLLRGYSSRTFTGLALSPDYPQSGSAFVFGPGEGLWVQEAADSSWRSEFESLPFSEINHLDGYTNSTERFGLLAATPEGLWLSSDDARSWRQLLPGACYSGCASPSGRLLLAAQTHEGLRLSEDGGDSWRDVPGPWQLGGRILACQVSDRRQIHLALLENMQESVSFWQGLPGEIEEVIRLPAPANPVVSLWTPPSALPDRPWYASLGSQVWKFSARRSGGRRNEVRINEVHLSGARAHSSLLPETERGEPIVALEGFQDSERIEIYASSGPRLYRSSDDAQTWTPVFDFGRRRVVSLSRLSPGSEARWMVLFLGGEIGILYE